VAGRSVRSTPEGGLGSLAPLALLISGRPSELGPFFGHPQPERLISRSSTFRRVMKELDIESHRIGFGRGAEYVWRLKPPNWTRGLDVHG
jgi:hypothetical protein